MINFFRKTTEPKVPKDIVFKWAEEKDDINLLRWFLYNSKEDYEEQMGVPYNKIDYIKENLKELEKIYVIRQNPELRFFLARGGEIRSIGGERPLSALKKDRKYTSEQDWERNYRHYRVSDILRYKKHSNQNIKASVKTKPSTKKCWEYTIGGL